MRWVQALAGCLGALATSACAPVSEQYFREGVGVTLNSGQLAQATQLQDEYIYYICRQAGGFNEAAAAGPSCAGTDWTTFTVAGMNDIDQRCDAYLDWLDAQRRDRTPVLAQIAAMGAATSGIMGVAGAGTQAIAIVATAFGLAGQSYANWNSRLLLDVDHSTVQALVYRRQQQYRQSIYNIAVPSRASAIYLLRGYLRLCMPITIETDINNTVTLAQSGVPGSVIEAPLVRPIPLLTPREIARTRIPEVNKPAGGLSPPVPRPTVGPEFIRQVQLALCVPKKDGVLGGDTVQAIQTYLQAKGKSVPKNIDALSLQPVLQDAIDDVGDCRKKGFKNAYEVAAFGVPADHTEHRIETLQKNINAFFTEQNEPGKIIIVTGKLDPQTRTAISQVNQLLSLPEGDEIGSELNLRLH